MPSRGLNAPATAVPAPTAPPGTRHTQPRAVRPQHPPPENLGPPPAVTFQLTAQNVSFDKTEVRARAGAQVTAVLTNKDGT